MIKKTHKYSINTCATATHISTVSGWGRSNAIFTAQKHVISGYSRQTHQSSEYHILIEILLYLPAYTSADCVITLTTAWHTIACWCVAACQKLQKEQVGPLSQAIRAAACLSLGQNITAKSVHLTSLYPTALTSINDHLSVLRHYVCT